MGFTWPHGVFDGVGAAVVLRALGDEAAGRSWTVPGPRLVEGYNENPLQCVLDEACSFPKRMGVVGEGVGVGEEERYKGMRAVPWWIAIWAILWCAWETWWLGAQYRLVVVPRKVYLRLAEEVREEVRRNGEGGPNPDKITTGDVLTAFLFKASYRC